MSYFKLNTDGSCQTANKQHEGFESFDLLAKQTDGSLFDFYLTTPDTNGTYQADTNKIQAAQEAKTLEELKTNGEVYILNGVDYMIPFKTEDAIGMMQVKTAFEMGVLSTNIKFSNGVTVPIEAVDFLAFALWFVEKRNSFFV